MSLITIKQQATRRSILKLLKSQSDYSSPALILQQAVESVEGIKTDREFFNQNCDWLEKQNLIKIEGMTPSLSVVLTQLGLDVAEYKITFKGISKLTL